MLEVTVVTAASVMPSLLEGTWLLRLCEDPDVRRAYERGRPGSTYRWYGTLMNHDELLYSRIKPSDIPFTQVSLKLGDGMLGIISSEEPEGLSWYHADRLHYTTDAAGGLVTISASDGSMLCQLIRAEHYEPVTETLDEFCTKMIEAEKARQLEQVTLLLQGLVQNQPLVVVAVAPVTQSSGSPRFTGVKLQTQDGTEIVIEVTPGRGISVAGRNLDQM